MGFQTLEILRQGLWASITGGWFYDPHHNLFCNTFHFYTWITLIMLPFLVHLWTSSTVWYPWIGYSTIILLAFAAIKIINLHLHLMFDQTEPIEERPHDKHSWRKENHSNSEVEDIELQVFNTETRGNQSVNNNPLPPPLLSGSQCVSEPDEGEVSRSRILQGEQGLSSICTDSAADIHKGEQHCDVEVDIHRKNSSASIGQVVSPVEPKPASETCVTEVGSFLIHDSSSLRAMVSLKSVEAEDAEEGGIEEVTESPDRSCLRSTAAGESGRRFSNISNLAFEMSNATTSAPRLQGAGGSLELGFILENSPTAQQSLSNNPSRAVGVGPSSFRRTLSALVSNSSTAASYPATSTVSAPQNVGVGILCSPVSPASGLQEQKMEQSNQKQRVNPSTREPKVVSDSPGRSEDEGAVNVEFPGNIAHENNENFFVVSGESTGGPCKRQWETFLTSTPHHHFVSHSSSNTSCSSGSVIAMHQDDPYDRNVSLPRQLYAQPTFGDPNFLPASQQTAATAVNEEFTRNALDASACPWPSKGHNLDPQTWVSHSSSSSSTTDGIENEAARLLPLPPPFLPTLVSPSLCPSGVAAPSVQDTVAKTPQDQGAIPKRRQKFCGTNQIEEESPGEDISANPSGCQDELSQFTPPKRRKLAARRRRHPAGTSNSSSSNPTSAAYNPSRGCGVPSTLVDLGSGSENLRSRRHCINRPRRRRRTSAFSTASFVPSSPSSDPRQGPFSRLDCHHQLAVDQARMKEALAGPSAFVLPPSSFPWFATDGGYDGRHSNVADISSTSGANVSSATRLTNLSSSFGGTSNPTATSSSVVSLGSALTTAFPNRDSSDVVPQPPFSTNRETGLDPGRSESRNRPGRFAALRDDRDYRNRVGSSLHPTSSSNAPGINSSHVPDYFGTRSSSAFQNLLQNLHAGRSPLQFTNTPGSAHVSSSSVRHPFALPHHMAEVLARVNSLPSNNNQNDALSLDEQQLNIPSMVEARKSRRFYRLHLWPRCLSLKIRFDRLDLMALLDPNVGWWDSILCVALALLVGVLTAMVLSTGLLQDAFAFLLCLVCAGCQYSLLKSVQPDAVSPTHGFNRMVTMGRSIYFVLLASLVLLAHSEASRTTESSSSVSLYGARWGGIDQVLAVRNFLLNVLLCFPVIFSLGLLPQISTFSIYALEQIDAHIFGGTACTGLGPAAFAVARSVFLVALVYGPAYGGLREGASSQHILFSAGCGLLVAACYHVSRCSSDPSVLVGWLLQVVNPKQVTGDHPSEKQDKKSDGEKEADSDDNGANEDDSEEDPLPRRMREAVVDRLRSDVIVCLIIGVVVFGVHCSTVFTSQHLQPVLSEILWMAPSILGFILHYVAPQLRKQLPWLCFSRPLMRSHEYDQFEVHQPAKLMWFEKPFLWLTVLERHVLLPVFFLDVLTRDSPVLVTKFGLSVGTLLSVICSIKAVRSGMLDPSTHYLTITFTKLLFSQDLAGCSETFLLDYFVCSLLVTKLTELLLKMQFIITYIAPWQITWGSAFHAFAQPFSVPHSAMLFVQAIVSSVISAPLAPFLGSAIFFTSYVRPIKFWERDYNTRRVDASNTRLVSQLEPTRSPGGDDNNLNSIFYEHLTRSLQQSLAGDLMLGRWGGPVSQGDCYVLASDNLNCLVHLIELGNGMVTFQVRGLEFRGTYCQQREVEAISEGVEEDDSCCCCEPGHLPHMLGGNAAFNQRWLAWQVMATKYVLEGYSISDNNAASMLHVFDLRRLLVTYYVKSVIYYATRSPRLSDWLSNPSIVEALQFFSSDRSFADLDPVFNINIDEDYDYHVPGITRNSFCSVYLGWIQYCAARRNGKPVDSGRDSLLVSLCLALSLLGRRALGSAAHTSLSSVEFFLYGLHALFKGDFRITSFKDEWVFNDMELLRRVVAPGVRMSIKLHQDHFTCPDEYDDPSVLYEAITTHEEKLVISHEGDPAWRRAVLTGAPSLLALRHVVDDNSDEYKIVMLNKRFLSFRVIKLNRECVRGLWAGQQQELVYLRNRNQERGSIQNAKQVLRNIINSSCDQPIGYPIYVSPLMTSFAESHPQIRSTLGGPLSINAIRRAALAFFRRLQDRCGEGSSGRCSSGRSGGAQCPDVEISLENVRPSVVVTPHPTGAHESTSCLTSPVAAAQSRLGYPLFGSFATNSIGGGTSGSGGSMGLVGASGGMTLFASGTAQGSSPRNSLGPHGRGSVVSTMSGTLRKPSGSTLISLAGMLADRDSSSMVAEAAAASGSGSSSAALGGTLNNSVLSVRERGSSRGSNNQERERDVRLRRNALDSESIASVKSSTRQRSFSSRINEEERRGTQDQSSSRRRERERHDRFHRLDGDHPFHYESEPFMDSSIRINQWVKIVDPMQVYDTINLGRRIDVLWPNPTIRNKGGKNFWKNWLPEAGMKGQVVHRWVPNHPDSHYRSHVDRVILLLQIDDKYVPIAESAVELLDPNVQDDSDEKASGYC